MKEECILNGKTILVVDDESDVLDTVEEILSMCLVSKAKDYETAIQYLFGYTYDIVILDIMGVNGFELLKKSVARGFPTVMLTAHAVTAESLKSSISLGAVFFLPKDEMSEIKSFLEEVVLGGGKPIWAKLFDRLDSYFQRRFGPDWKEKERIFREVKESNLRDREEGEK